MADLAPIPEGDLRLSDLRFQAGLTQADVAAALGVGSSRISDIDRGRRPVDDDTVAALAALYKVSPELLQVVWQRTVDARATRLRNR